MTAVNISGTFAKDERPMNDDGEAEGPVSSKTPDVWLDDK